MKDFIINTRDFCCKTLALKRKLEKNGYKAIYECIDRKNPSQKLWFFEVDERMIGIISDHIGQHVIWTF